MALLLKNRLLGSSNYRKYLLTSLTAAICTFGESLLICFPPRKTARLANHHFGVQFRQVGAATKSVGAIFKDGLKERGSIVPNKVINTPSRFRKNTSALFEGKDSGDDQPTRNTKAEIAGFSQGDKILVEVVSFGKLGASVNIVGRGFDDSTMVGPTEPILARGLILQQEIHYFRLARGGIDVVKGEILPAYVENVREELNKIDVSLRPPGGMAKSIDLSCKILDLLAQSQEGVLDIGDKSSPDEINSILPGTSKLAFKKAVSALYKQKKIILNPKAISLVQ